MNNDIHGYSVALKRELSILDEEKISDVNRTTIKKFYEDNLLRGISKPRLIKLVLVMRMIAKVLDKPFQDATIEDIKRVVMYIDEVPSWRPWTKVTHKAVLKKFYKWLGGEDDAPKIVRWVKTTLRVQELPMLSEHDLITADEIQRAIDAADHPRNKAFLALLAESGCRVSEIGTLRIKNITFDAQGAILTVNGKTGPRRIRVINAAPLLATWINCHPFRDEPEAPVWIYVCAKRNREQMQYSAITKLIKDAFKAAGIKKRCNPHTFRHSRASLMANHLTEFQMNHYFGWTQGSAMPSTYVHLSGKDLDGAILKMNGIGADEKKPELAKPKTCPRCESINAVNSKYCTKCAAILDEAMVIEEQKKLIVKPELVAGSFAELMKNPEIQKVVIEKLVELNLKKVFP